MLETFAQFTQILWDIASNPVNIAIVFAASFLGIIFGSMPGLTATLGVALLTTLTYGLDVSSALLALLGLYVGAIYGGSYPSILINIPGTAAAAASAVEGYPMACRGEGGQALGLTTTASMIGTVFGLLILVLLAPLIATVALQFTSFEFFLLAIFGILISGTLASQGNALKGWIAGFIGLFMAMVGRDTLQFFPRFTFDNPQLDSGLDIVPVLIGAFGIPQIIKVIGEKKSLVQAQKFTRVLPEMKTIFKNIKNIFRSSMIGVGIGAVPGIGEDIAGWVSYGVNKSKKPKPDEKPFGEGNSSGLIAAETANNACIGGALIPLLTLGIPGSAPAAMLLGALMLHGVNPGPTLAIDKPEFLLEVTAVMVLASLAMFCNGLFLAKQVVKLLRIPAPLFMPVIALLCVLGSYALGLSTFNLMLMLPVGILAYAMMSMNYPISPLVIGLILGPMADENIRRALLTTEGSMLPMLQRPVSLILCIAIVILLLQQIPWVGAKLSSIKQAVFGSRSG